MANSAGLLERDGSFIQSPILEMVALRTQENRGVEVEPSIILPDVGTNRLKNRITIKVRKVENRAAAKLF